MAVYTVYEPPSSWSATPQPERFVFVRDSFSPVAMLFGPLWMLRHRMWLVLVGYALVVALLALVLQFVGSARVSLLAWTLLGLLTGFEAATLRRFTLKRRGFRSLGVVVGDDLDSAERRFFDTWLHKMAEARRKLQMTGPLVTVMPRVRSTGLEVLGLFPEPRQPQK